MVDSKTLDADRALISSLGGVTKLANRLDVSVQAVSNWNTRGIPAKVKLRHPELFLGLKLPKVATAMTAKAA